MTTSNQPMFKPNADGYDLSPTGAFLIVAGTAYGDPRESTPEGIAKSHAFVDAVLSAAHAGGYKQCDILKTLLSRNHFTRRVAGMAQDAVNAAGDTAMLGIFNRFGIQTGPT